MITEYYKKFLNECGYLNVTPSLINRFESYLIRSNTPIEEAYDHIGRFTDLLPVATITKKNYRTRLRRYLEYVYKEKGIKQPTENGKTILKITGEN